MSVQVRRCTEDDLQHLQAISIDTFYETFKEQNSPKNMQAYLDNAFNLGQLKKELTHPDSYFYFAYVEGEIAGYLKVNIDNAQTEVIGNRDEALEIQRIYIKKEFQQQGVGTVLCDQVMNLAKKHRKKMIWLGVWEHNEQAISFYKKMGFTQIGTHSFFMGDDEQTDLIFSKEISFDD